MLNNLISGVAMQLAHWFVTKFGVVRSIVHIGIIDRALVTFFVLLNTITSGILMNIVTSIAHGFHEIASEDLLQSRYSKEQRATMGSLVGLGGSLIYGAVAVAVGVLADYIGLLNTMLVMQPLLLLSSYFFYKGIKLGNHK